VAKHRFRDQLSDEALQAGAKLKQLAEYPCDVSGSHSHDRVFGILCGAFVDYPLNVMVDLWRKRAFAQRS
jgi:hypothetical protein